MIPMRTSSIFKSRWMAILWAAGVIWLAYDVAGSAPAPKKGTATAAQPTDATGAPISPEDEKKFEQILNGL
jgi:uncharacterized membrane protein